VVHKPLSIPNRRELWVLGILLVPIVLGVVLSFQDQTSKATLFVEEPTPSEEATIIAKDGAGTGEIKARPRIVSFRGVPLDGTPLTAPSRQEVEFLLPVTKVACSRLKAAFNGACGRSAGNVAPKTASPLRVVWPSAGDVSVRSAGLSSLSVSPTPVVGASKPVTTWNLRAGAERTEIEFECIEESRFFLELRRARRNPRCARASTLLRIPLLLLGSQSAAISLAGVEWWHLLAKGQSASLMVNRGELFVGGDDSPLRESKTPVTISAERSGGVELEVANPGGDANTGIRVVASEANSVEENHESKLPNLLSKYKEYWFLFLGMIGGVLFSVILERVPPRARIPADGKGGVGNGNRDSDAGPGTGDPDGGS
jgi:hypothetical protein